MKNKSRVTQPAQEVTENKESFESREQDTLTSAFVPPMRQSATSMDALSQAEPETPTRQAGKRLWRKVLVRLPVPLQQIVTTFFERVKDTDPEHMDVSPEAGTHTVIGWGWLPVLTLGCALGLFSIAYGFAAARHGQMGLEITFVIGLLLIFVPTMVRQLSPRTLRLERIATVCVVGLCLYLIDIMASPTYFSSYDEFLHWRSADDLIATGHLFTPNALLPVGSYYPGLEIVTNALSMLSGFNTFYTGVVVVGIARLIMVLALFLLNEQIMKSSRIASIATLIYMSNPHFLLFDAQYAYESLALPLAMCVLFMVELHQTMYARFKQLESSAPPLLSVSASRKRSSNDLLWITCMTCMVIAAVVFTHHVTGFFLDELLILWVITYGLLRWGRLYSLGLVKKELRGEEGALRGEEGARKGRDGVNPSSTHWSEIDNRKLFFNGFLHVTKIALVAIGITILCVMRSGNPVVNYLGSFFEIAVNELSHIAVGASSARPLFQSYTGIPAPLWERLLTVAAQGLVMLGLPVGLLCLWKRYRSNVLVCTFGVMALGYPLVQVFRFTVTGSEVVDRSAAFLFIPIASVLAVLIIQFWPVRYLKRQHITVLIGLLAVIFLGGTISGLGPALALLPGGYMVSADARSIEPEGIGAAMWAGTYLGADNRTEGDRINQLLMADYGRQRAVTIIQDGVDASPVFLAAQFNSNAARLLKSGNIRYLVVDMRISQNLPVIGFYYSESEFDAFNHVKPPNPEVLTKFDTVPGANKIFSSGNIVIYDMEGVLNAPT